MSRIVVIGAGPAGLAAAWMASRRGHDVSVLEKGDVGDTLRRWGPVRFFSPLRMNMPMRMLSELGLESALDENLSASEMRERVLQPALSLPALRDRIRTHTRVVAVARRGMTRTDYPAHPLRGERGFLLLTEAEGREELHEADVVFDATGGYQRPSPFGPGGLPAIGERELGERVIRDHRTLAERLPRLHDRTVLLVGHGHSAANALLMLETSGASVLWSVRTPNERPCVAVANDPLPERDRVVQVANDHATAAASRNWLTVRRRSVIRQVERDGDRLRVTFFGDETVEVDEIAAFTGYAPNGAHTRELALEISPVSEGNARLWRAISGVTDCLALPTISPADLATGEPNYWFIGGRAYGRARSFLLQAGLQHTEAILEAVPR